MAARLLGISYGPIDLLADLARPDLWLALARQLRYGRVRTAADWLYPFLRPPAVFGGHFLGRRYWR